MKVAALLAIAGVGYSSKVCRDLKFATGRKCQFGFSGSQFRVMPFNKVLPSECSSKDVGVCTVQVCGTEAQFEEDIVIEGMGKKVNSWNFDLFDGDLKVMVPKEKCESGSDKYCCGMMMRLDSKGATSARYTWPVSTDAPTRSPSGMPTIKPSDMPSLKPSAMPSGAPSRAPTRKPTSGPTLMPTTGAPSTAPSMSPTMKTVTLAPTMPKPCKFMNAEECKADEFCKARKGKKGKPSTCQNTKCKKYKKPAKCEEAPHCEPGKIKDGKTKCTNKKF